MKSEISRPVAHIFDYALEKGMDIKSLSSLLSHVSFATTIDIYSHMTNATQRQAAAKIGCQIGSTEAEIPSGDEQVRIDTDQPDFEPYKSKIRKSGTDCVTMINDHLYEGRTPMVNVKRIIFMSKLERNVRKNLQR